jgi:hypothetical protein
MPVRRAFSPALMEETTMKVPDERSHGSGNRNANSGQTSDRQELPETEHGDSRPPRAASSDPGRAEDDTQETDAEEERQKAERLGRAPAEGGSIPE